MEDGKLGVAIHGADWVAHAHAASWLKSPRATIVSVSDIDVTRAQRFAEEFQLDCAIRDDYEQVLRDARVDTDNRNNKSSFGQRALKTRRDKRSRKRL